MTGLSTRLPGWRGMHKNEIDLAKSLRFILTVTNQSPAQLRAQVRQASALSVRQGDVLGEMTRGLLRAALRANGTPSATIVLGELEANTCDIVDKAIISYMRWANRAMWDEDPEIARIIALKTALSTGPGFDDEDPDIGLIEEEP